MGCSWDSTAPFTLVYCRVTRCDVFRFKFRGGLLSMARESSLYLWCFSSVYFPLQTFAATSRRNALLFLVFVELWIFLRLHLSITEDLGKRMEESLGGASSFSMALDSSP